MPERFRPPQFLREGVEPELLYGEEYGEGTFAVVAKLENLPPSVKESVPQGYVVKQYKMSEHDWDDTIFDVFDYYQLPRVKNYEKFLNST